MLQYLYLAIAQALFRPLKKQESRKGLGEQGVKCVKEFKIKISTKVKQWFTNLGCDTNDIETKDGAEPSAPAVEPSAEASVVTMSEGADAEAATKMTMSEEADAEAATKVTRSEEADAEAATIPAALDVDDAPLSSMITT